MYGMRGYRQQYQWHHRPHPFFFIIPVLFMLFIGFTLLKFLWPLLLIGFGIMLFKGMSRGGFGPRGGDWSRQKQYWHDKYKNEWGDKPKHEGDDRHFTQTADGEWVEIV